MNKFNLSYNVGGIELQDAISSEDILVFADGSVRVKLNPEIFKGSLSCTLAESFKIGAYIQSMDDLMVVAQIVDILRKNTRVIPQFTLQITSPVYSRYDRVMLEDRTDGFGLNTFVKFIKVTGVDTVELYDPHSEVFGKLLELNGLKVITQLQAKIVQLTLGIHDFIRVYPDKGSLKKQCGNGYAPVIFDKVRSVDTGRILGVECIEGRKILSNEQDAPFMIVDDICEGGGTFLGVAKEFWKLSHSANELQLMVTHGLFTKNAFENLFNLGFFSKISAFIMKESTYNSIPEEYLDRVTVKHIVKGI